MTVVVCMAASSDFCAVNGWSLALFDVKNCVRRLVLDCEGRGSPLLSGCDDGMLCELAKGFESLRGIAKGCLAINDHSSRDSVRRPYR